MKIIYSRKLAIAVGGILAATVAAGCFGGDPGYSNGYNSSYGSSYPYSGYNNGYSYPRSSENSYKAGYRNGVRADENEHAVVERDRGEARIEAQHSIVGRGDNYSRTD